MSEVL
ncbi:Thioredoxin, partial [Haemophilus influenzae]